MNPPPPFNLKDRKSRLKSAEQVRQHKSNRRRLPMPDVVDEDIAPSQTKSVTGDCPPIADKAIWISDSAENKGYMVARLSKDNIPTADFYCLDFSTMKWTNLTHSLTHRDIHSPFSAENCTHQPNPIAFPGLPGYTIFRLYRRSFLLLFGGHNADGQALSRLIVIDLYRLEWWYQPVLAGIVTARIDPTMVAIDRKLYIFGGYKYFRGQGGAHASYSIAALSDDGKTWEWEVRDVPYPEIVPPGTIFAEATAVYNGVKILLTPWRRPVEKRKIDFNEDNVFCFHIRRRKFQLIDVSGDLPKQIGWYFNFCMTPSASPSAEQYQGPNTSMASTSSTRASQSGRLSSSSVIICGWMACHEDDYLPEIWNLELTPIEHISKLNIAPIVDHLDSQVEPESDLRVAFVIDEKLFLLGARPGAVNKDDDSIRANAYIDFSLRRLCAQS